MKPHKHCEVIKAWADGAEIEMLSRDNTWKPIENPQWGGEDYRIKPPAPKWPETTMSDEELAFASTATYTDYRAVANAALAHACETKQVLPVIDGAVTIPSGINVQISGVGYQVGDNMLFRVKP